jgi:hypothetical protein
MPHLVKKICGASLMAGKLCAKPLNPRQTLASCWYLRKPDQYKKTAAVTFFNITAAGNFFIAEQFYRPVTSELQHLARRASRASN